MTSSKLQEFIPCIIPPKGELRIGQAGDNKGLVKNLGIYKVTYRSGFKKNNGAMTSKKSKFPSILKRVKNLVGAGPHLLLLGILLEGLTIALNRSLYQRMSFGHDLVQ
jgi:hypothetical protein